MDLLYFLLTSYIFTTLLFPLTLSSAGSTRFTKFPKDGLYVAKGKTARFEWDYQVGTESGKTLDSQSPRWYFFNVSLSSDLLIGYGDAFKGRIFKLSPSTCPVQFRTPAGKVTVEGKATLVIKSVTLADSGVYSCQLALAAGSIASWPRTKSRLIVTETPIFTVKPNNLIAITEHKNLSISCSAIGSPKPVVKWINVSNNMATVSQGIGSAVLTIPKITRHYSGRIYKCQAENNPNGEAEETSTVLQVNYKPSVDLSSSSIAAKSWEGNIIKLRCKWSDARPIPTWSWSGPNDVTISSNIIKIDKGSELTLTTGSSNGDYGLYACKATNEAGSVSHNINVTRLFPPGPPNVTVTNVEAFSAQVQWTKPAYNGGSQITGYKVEVNQNCYSLTANTLIKLISDLGNNKSYDVKVWAINVVGYGKFSVKTFKTKVQGSYLSTTSEYTPQSTRTITASRGGSLVTSIALGVLFGVALICNFLLVAYIIWWKRKGNNQNPNTRSKNDKDEVLYMNSMSLQDKPSKDGQNIVQHEPADSPNTTIYQPVNPQSDTYSSLSPSTKLPPKPDVTTSGVYQDLQANYNQYQSLDHFIQT